jgi:hypothetical protein
MPALETFAGERLGARELDPSDWASGAWIDRLPGLLDRPRTPHDGNAAGEVARIIVEVATT